MLVRLILADRKQLQAPVGSAEVLAADPGPPAPHPRASVAPLSFCCIEGYIQSLHLAALMECCGCAPHPSPGQPSMKEYQSRVEEGAERVMSVLVTWLMADLPL